MPTLNQSQHEVLTDAESENPSIPFAFAVSESAWFQSAELANTTDQPSETQSLESPNLTLISVGNDVPRNASLVAKAPVEATPTGTLSIETIPVETIPVKKANATSFATPNREAIILPRQSEGSPPAQPAPAIAEFGDGSPLSLRRPTENSPATAQATNLAAGQTGSQTTKLASDVTPELNIKPFGDSLNRQPLPQTPAGSITSDVVSTEKLSIQQTGKKSVDYDSNGKHPLTAGPNRDPATSQTPQQTSNAVQNSTGVVPGTAVSTSQSVIGSSETRSSETRSSETRAAVSNEIAVEPRPELSTQTTSNQSTRNTTDSVHISENLPRATDQPEIRRATRSNESVNDVTLELAGQKTKTSITRLDYQTTTRQENAQSVAPTADLQVYQTESPIMRESAPTKSPVAISPMANSTMNATTEALNQVKGRSQVATQIQVAPRAEVASPAEIPAENGTATNSASKQPTITGDIATVSQPVVQQATQAIVEERHSVTADNHVRRTTPFALSPAEDAAIVNENTEINETSGNDTQHDPLAQHNSREPKSTANLFGRTDPISQLVAPDYASVDAAISTNPQSDGSVFVNSNPISIDQPASQPIQTGKILPASPAVTQTVINQVVDTITVETGSIRDFIGANNSRQLSMQINPPELGRLDIVIDSAADVMTAQIVASESVTSEMLVKEKSQLINALREQGIDLPDVDISHHDAHDPRQQTFESPHWGRRKGHYQSPANEPEPEIQTDEIIQPTTRSRIDLVA